MVKFNNKKLYTEYGINLYTDNIPTSNCEIKIEAPCSMEDDVVFSRTMKFGAFSYIVSGCLIHNAEIGRYCSIAKGVKIGLGNHPTDWLSTSPFQYIDNVLNWNSFLGNKLKNIKKYEYSKTTYIGNDVWIGTDAIILDGIKIGDGAIIGANSVVTKDIEPYSISFGSPAKHIRYRFDEKIIKELQELKWWEYNIADLNGVDFDDIEKAIKQIKTKIKNNEIQKYIPKVVTNDTLKDFKLEKKKKSIFSRIFKKKKL